ncbi:MAG: hypothetical protein FJ387_06955 [Verrucomicrobia bacterium]|nr:hypothetical protein [Verrucomicrobiota bacterium]
MNDQNEHNGTKSLVPLVLLLVCVGGGVLWFSCQLYEKLGFSLGVNVASTLATWAVAILFCGEVAVRLRGCERALLKSVLALTLLFSSPLLFFVVLFTVLGYAPF